MPNAVYIYQHPSEHPTLTVHQHIIIRAIKSLNRVEALALIRGSFVTENGGWVPLEEAKEIYSSIMGRL